MGTATPETGRVTTLCRNFGTVSALWGGES
jgi:hypothetical protein